jgi:guanidinopropionase
MRISIGFGWSTLVAAEMVAANVGLGQMVLNASQLPAHRHCGGDRRHRDRITAVAFAFDLLMRWVELRRSVRGGEDVNTPREFFKKPITGSVMPRFAGLATLMRLPYVQKTDPEFADVDIGLVGRPSGWRHHQPPRQGARHGPRQARDNISTMIRNVNRASGIAPFTLCNCAEPGRHARSTPGRPDGYAGSAYEAFFSRCAALASRPAGVAATTWSSLPVHARHRARTGRARHDALRRPHRHLGRLFRRLLIHPRHAVSPRHRGGPAGPPTRTVQIGIRGALVQRRRRRPGAWSRACRVIDIDEFNRAGRQGSVLAEARRVVGDGPTYVSFDVDCARPGVRTRHRHAPEIGGITTLRSPAAGAWPARPAT